ncbi:hypothetical protein MH928_00475 [Flavobacterium sp. WW92]|uniref:hypothetical protein n=1 Tax=unclassified Flavobacterium TaxID=196869 RepID=UPI002225979F|nr:MULTISPECIES: hypothetical protein [unclassified Flavobacterium]WDO13190.1 hypothetical protein MH928_00475 [Flavobacterium sp. WW92]
MKSKSLFIGLFGLSVLFANAQNVQSNSLLTSGGLNAGSGGAGQNTYYGYEAGMTNTLGNHNTFIGNFSGKYNANWGNTFLGSYAGQSNSSGFANTFVGIAAGDETNGHSNTYVGAYSGYLNNDTHSTFLGLESGNNSSGGYNVYVGAGAGEGTIGEGNVFLGIRSGFSQTIDGAFIVENYNYSQPNPLIKGEFATGKVGINVTDFPSTAGSVDVSGYKFFVKGGLLAEEIRVATTWADYVFEESYKLPSLKEVEQHIAEKGHLMNVPSAKQVEQDGISVGEMAKIQQEKIEELTLYIIEQNKINEKQAEELKELREMVQSLAAKK